MTQTINQTALVATTIASAVWFVMFPMGLFKVMYYALEAARRTHR